MSSIKYTNIGLKQYQPTWEYQQKWMETGLENRKNNLPVNQEILFVEHPHVYTLGKSANDNHLLVNQDFLKKINATSYHIERGGDITYHGPGQLVVYPLLDLDLYKIGAKTYIKLLEQVIVDILLDYDIKAHRIKEKTGIWLDQGKTTERKIAAIGIKCSRHLTMHGLAININTNLDYFNHIIPCGLADSNVTSLSKELGKDIPLASVIRQFKIHFNNHFNN